MKRWNLIALAIIVVALLLLPAASRAAGEFQREALRGLKGVYVVVENIDSQANHLGLNENQIKTDVELRLRKAGIRVLEKKEWVASPGAPHLFVYVNTYIRSDIGICAYSIRLELNEMVTLARGFEVVGTIWERGATGMVGVDKIRELRTSVSDQVDKFINGYLAANAK